MPIDFEIYPDLRIVLTIVTGSIDDRMSIDNAVKLGNHPDFDSSFHQIIDVTAITANRLTEDGMEEISRITPFSRSSRRAFIVAENNMVTKAGYFSRLSTIVSDNIFVTNSREKAYEWLLG